MVLCLLTIKSYEYVSDKVGYKISTEIETYKKQHSDYPSDLNSVNKNLKLNIFEQHIIESNNCQQVLLCGQRFSAAFANTVDSRRRDL